MRISNKKNLLCIIIVFIILVSILYFLTDIKAIEETVDQVAEALITKNIEMLDQVVMPDTYMGKYYPLFGCTYSELRINLLNRWEDNGYQVVKYEWERNEDYRFSFITQKINFVMYIQENENNEIYSIPQVLEIRKNFFGSYYISSFYTEMPTDSKEFEVRRNFLCMPVQ
ncbi:MAG: hypothetical protein ACI4DW_07945 [Lachnospiraceae bacterium]